MNIHHLELFYYVARHGGIMPAVRHMPYGIQQPAVSSQILQLEEDLGVKLFQRRPFELTASGGKLFAHIEPFFGKLDALADTIRGGTRQLVRLAAPDPVLREHLPEILRVVRLRFPQLRVTLKAARQDQVEELVDRGELDLAITPLGLAPARNGLSLVELVRLPMALLVPKDSPFKNAHELLAAHGDGSWSAPLISRPAEELIPRRFREELAARSLEWPASIEVDSIDLVETYVARGFGVGLTALRPNPGKSPVRVLALKEFDPIRIVALWRGEMSPVVAALLEAVRSRAEEMTKGS